MIIDYKNMFSMYNNPIFSFAASLILFISCTSPAPNRLSVALRFAGENRGELEKVLDHYQDDTLKYKSACFLIENMPHYYSYEKDAYLKTQAAMKQAREDYNNYDVSLLNNRANSFDHAVKIYDSQVITAEYLIENIDFAFKLWEEKPWNKYLSFEDFCEYLLPYRIGNEPLENWRKIYYEKYNPVLDSLYSGTDVIEAANLLNLHIGGTEKIYYLHLSHIEPGALFYLDQKCGDCVDFRDLSIFLLRSVGIPAGGDLYSISPDENAEMHTWAIIQDTTGRSVPFRYPGLDVGRDIGGKYRKGKVYRLYFGLQENEKRDVQMLPPFFRYPYLRDVTSNYLTDENTYLLPVERYQGGYAYLGVHTADRTTLIAVGEITDGKAKFENVEPGLIYQLFTYDKENMQPAGYPVLLKENNQIHQFKADTSRRQPVRLFRKHRLPDWLYYDINSIVGGVIEASADAGFSSLSFHYAIQDSVRDVITKTFYPDPSDPIRYVRYRAPRHRAIDLSEVVFSREGDGARIIDMSVSGDKSGDIYKNGSLGNISDGDPLTYYRSADEAAVVVFDLKKETRLSRIEITPRTDDNYIRIGDVYELFYHAGGEGWKSLGKQTAKELFLDYDNIPENALLWLHNRTRGREEQVFCIKDGRQVFTGRT
jgi:hypothetical protein